MSPEEKLLREIFKEGPARLGDLLPSGFFKLPINSFPGIDRLLYVNATRQFCKWPGPERNVFDWWIMETGQKVAWRGGSDIKEWDFIIRN